MGHQRNSLFTLLILKLMFVVYTPDECRTTSVTTAELEELDERGQSFVFLCIVFSLQARKPDPLCASNAPK